jgi:hypothetical protein
VAEAYRMDEAGAVKSVTVIEAIKADKRECWPDAGRWSGCA